ncbi:Tm-1-like ATP-binding domain-containing protein [Chelativorans oligotrophicus]|uniref:Tm-1-like ATP-binding domain-containing protein n=1 Tax=Chelativorans oligotrophicus TaxID=449974 RepID=UPI001407DCF7|nr:Tm-1-like ATP-binding domain-containing protein [Chelativorans oligotrophicus]
MSTVVLMGTLDTKGAEYAFLRDEIEKQGIETLLVDTGILGDPSTRPDISRSVVAEAADADLAALIEAHDRGAAVSAMAKGAAALALRLYEEGKLDAIAGLGGTGGTALVTAAMRALPIDVPKLMVSTVASGDTRAYVGSTDITMMHSVVDIAGINKISRKILGNAAGAVAGMAGQPVTDAPSREAPLIAATMFGVTTPCVQKARELLERSGFEVLTFHATGTGGRSMEELTKAGMFSAVLDVTTTELADELVGGVFSAGPDRLTAAGAAGIPQIVSLGALDMVNFGAWETVPEKFRERNLYRHNASITLMRTTPQECLEIGRRLGSRLSQSKGPTVVFVPLKGISLIARAGQPFHDPEADNALLRGLRESLRADIEIREFNTDINDPSFAEAMVEALIEIMAEKKVNAHA